jgi:hypothetical protein
MVPGIVFAIAIIAKAPSNEDGGYQRVGLVSASPQHVYESPGKVMVLRLDCTLMWCCDCESLVMVFSLV